MRRTKGCYYTCRIRINNRVPRSMSKTKISEPVILPRNHSISRALIAQAPSGPASSARCRFSTCSSAVACAISCLGASPGGLRRRHRRAPRGNPQTVSQLAHHRPALPAGACTLWARHHRSPLRSGRSRATSARKAVPTRTRRTIPARRRAPASVADQNIFGNQEGTPGAATSRSMRFYYDIRDFSVVDYANGADDLKAGVRA